MASSGAELPAGSETRAIVNAVRALARVHYTDVDGTAEDFVRARGG
jgi:hypothetical protein